MQLFPWKCNLFACLFWLKQRHNLFVYCWLLGQWTTKMWSWTCITYGVSWITQCWLNSIWWQEKKTWSFEIYKTDSSGCYTYQIACFKTTFYLGQELEKAIDNQENLKYAFYWALNISPIWNISFCNLPFFT